MLNMFRALFTLVPVTGVVLFLILTAQNEMTAKIDLESIKMDRDFASEKAHFAHNDVKNAAKELKGAGSKEEREAARESLNHAKAELARWQAQYTSARNQIVALSATSKVTEQENAAIHRDLKQAAHEADAAVAKNRGQFPEQALAQSQGNGAGRWAGILAFLVVAYGLLFYFKPWGWLTAQCQRKLKKEPK